MAEEAKWYVAHTYSGYENKVKEDLEKTVENRGLQDMILERQNLVRCAQHPRRYGLRRPGIKARAPYR